MKKTTLEILLKVADLLDQIPEGDLLEDKIIPDDDEKAQNDYTFAFRVREYRFFEKDPLLARIFGALLRTDAILAQQDLAYRQRSQWRDWFAARFYLAMWWKAEKLTGYDGKKFRIADPRNWFPMPEET